MARRPPRSLPHPRAADIRLEDVLLALADPIRRGLVRRLRQGHPQPCHALGPAVAKSTLSHHFAVLRRSGVTRTRIEGRTRTVSLRSDDLERRFPGLLDAILGPEEP